MITCTPAYNIAEDPPPQSVLTGTDVFTDQNQRVIADERCLQLQHRLRTRSAASPYKRKDTEHSD